MNKWIAMLIISLLVSAFGFQIWYQYMHYADLRWYYTFMQLLSYLWVIIWLHAIRQDVIAWPNFPKFYIIADIFLLILSISTWGATYGLSVKFSGPNHNDILIKDALTLHDATIVMHLSHHSIFLVGQTIVTMPSANVTRIAHAIP
jgi:hypothetical protein